jgi:hypothetical protein
VESSLREPLLLNFLPSGMGFTIITGQAQCCAQYSLTLPRKTLHMRGKKESKLWGHNSSSFFQSLINLNYCHLRHFPQILISKMAGFTFACGWDLGCRQWEHQHTPTGLPCKSHASHHPPPLCLCTLSGHTHTPLFSTWLDLIKYHCLKLDKLPCCRTLRIADFFRSHLQQRSSQFIGCFNRVMMLISGCGCMMVQCGKHGNASTLQWR